MKIVTLLFAIFLLFIFVSPGFAEGSQRGKGHRSEMAKRDVSRTPFGKHSDRFHHFKREKRTVQQEDSDGEGQGSESGTNRQHRSLPNTIHSDSAQVAWAREYASHLAASEDEAVDVTTDNAGNVYVVGGCYMGLDDDIATIKYDANGNLLWKQVFNDEINGGDEPKKIMVDDFGNVYSCGVAEDSLNSGIVILKYSPMGGLLWKKIIAAEGVFYVNDYSIVFDNDRFVFTYGTGPITTMAVSTEGDIQWSVPMAELLESQGTPVLSIDALHNVIVSASVSGDSGDYDIYTVKYNATGVEQWNRMNTGDHLENDIPGFITIDSAGNIYVSGSTQSYSLMFIVGYSAAGDVRVEKYFTPHGFYDASFLDVRMDGSGNIYGLVGGYDSLSDDQVFLLYSYIPRSDSEWVRVIAVDTLAINEFSLIPFVKRLLTIDGTGNILVTFTGGEEDSVGVLTMIGYSTKKYSADGTLLWERNYLGHGDIINGPAHINTNVDGKVFVTGTFWNDAGGYDFTTLSYSPAGDSQWVATFDNTGTRDYGKAVVTDSAGNIYVGGTVAVHTSMDYLLIKYSPSGELEWKQTYNGTNNGRDSVLALTIDNAGDIIVTGRSAGISSREDIVTIKYNSEGERQWVARFDYTNQTDIPSGLVTDRENNVYVFGKGGRSRSYTFTTLKYSPAGEQLWTGQYTPPSQGNTLISSSMAIDDSANVVVTGYYTSGATDIFTTLKYNQQGLLHWISVYPDSHAVSRDGTSGMVIGEDGNIYIAGQLKGHGMIMKYTSGGVLDTVITNGDTLGANWGFRSIARQESGAFIVLGDVYSDSYPSVLCAYSSDLTKLWSNSQPNCVLRQLQLDGGGNIYISGYGGGDYVTMKYSATGGE